VLLDSIGVCDGLLSMLNVPVDVALLDAAPGLQTVSQMAVGLDNVDIGACRERGIRIGHTPDVLTETVADTAFALMGAVIRRLPEGQQVVRDGEWGPWEPWSMLGGDLHGATLGIVGMGRIGQAVARRATGFSMTVFYDSPRDMGVPDVTRVPLSDLLERCDVVVLTAPLNSHTRGLISHEELSIMRSEAYLINVARGPLVDTEALVSALSGDSIAGAGLDVTDPEPLSPDHPLLSLANCLVVPHIGSASWSARRGMARLAVENLIAGLSGNPMPAEYLGQ
jgi:lactate dehydrogenase-like 2-hydroxyacid dehydrogenase